MDINFYNKINICQFIDGYRWVNPSVIPTDSKNPSINLHTTNLLTDFVSVKNLSINTTDFECFR